MLIPAPARIRKRRFGPLDTTDLTISSEHNIFTKYNLADTSPDKQIQKKGYKFFEEMELRDTRYRSFLWTRKSAALHRGWDISPASEDQQDQARAACVKAGLLMARGAFKNDLRELLDAIPKGYKLSEKIYGLIPSGDFAGKVGLERLKALPQWDYGPVTDMKRHILGVASRFAVQTDLLPIEKFVLHVHNGTNEDPLGRGVASPCSWWYWFKHEMAKYWAIFNERFGMPFVTIEEPRNPAASDRSKVLELIKAVQAETGVVLPHGFALKLMTATFTGTVTYDGLINLSNIEMAMGVLGSYLAQQEGARHGSLAQSKEHGKTPSMYADDDADDLEETIQAQLVWDLDDMNFGLGDPYPEFRILRHEREVPIRDIPIAQRAGAVIPKGWFHTTYGIPVPQEGDEVLDPAALPPAAPAPGMGRFAETSELMAAQDDVDQLLRRAETLGMERYAAAFSELKGRLGKKKD